MEVSCDDSVSTPGSYFGERWEKTGAEESSQRRGVRGAILGPPGGAGSGEREAGGESI